jgi:hypothetical protein
MLATFTPVAAAATSEGFCTAAQEDVVSIDKHAAAIVILAFFIFICSLRANSLARRRNIFMTDGRQLHSNERSGAAPIRAATVTNGATRMFALGSG